MEVEVDAAVVVVEHVDVWVDEQEEEAVVEEEDQIVMTTRIVV